MLPPGGRGRRVLPAGGPSWSPGPRALPCPAMRRTPGLLFKLTAFGSAVLCAVTGFFWYDSAGFDLVEDFSGSGGDAWLGRQDGRHLLLCVGFGLTFLVLCLWSAARAAFRANAP